MKIKHLLLFLLLLISSQVFAKDSEKGPKQTKAKTSSGTDFLAALNAPHKRADVTFDFGTKELLSDAFQREIASIPGKPAPKTFIERASDDLQGVKHIFEFINASNRPITINDYDLDCACLSLGVWNGEVSEIFPYTVPAHQAVKIMAVVFPDRVAPGPIDATATLIGGRENSVLATIRMKGILDSNISFSPQKLKLRIPMQPSTLVHLKIDRHIQMNIPTDTLKVFSLNHNVTVSSVPEHYTIMGVKVDKDTIKLPKVFGGDLPHDLDIIFKVELSKSAPAGKSFSKIYLRLPDFPANMLIQNIEMWVEAEKMETTHSPLK